MIVLHYAIYVWDGFLGLPFLVVTIIFGPYFRRKLERREQIERASHALRMAKIRNREDEVISGQLRTTPTPSLTEGTNA